MTKFSKKRTIKEEDSLTPSATKPPAQENEKQPIVIKPDDKKKYLYEGALIVFSVLLALFLNELRNNWQEQRHTRQLLSNIEAEIIQNKKAVEENYQYNLAVLNNIDSALKSSEYEQNVQLMFGYLAPQGIFVEYINDIAWEVAKNNNISSKLDFETVSQLTEIYDQQIMIEKGYDMVGEILNNSVSLQIDKANEALYLIRGAYKGWAVDRMPGLLRSYDQVLDNLENIE